MPFKGGYNRDESYTREGIENKEYQDMIVWGTVAKTPKVYRYTNKKGKKSIKVDVLLKYEGGKGGYLSVLAFKDTYVVRQLSRLKWKEKAVIFGTLVKTTKMVKGELIPSISVYLDPAFVISESLLDTAFTLMNSPKFQEMLSDGFETDIGEEPAPEETTTKEADESDMGFA